MCNNNNSIINNEWPNWDNLILILITSLYLYNHLKITKPKLQINSYRCSSTSLRWIIKKKKKKNIHELFIVFSSTLFARGHANSFLRNCLHRNSSRPCLGHADSPCLLFRTRTVSTVFRVPTAKSSSSAAWAVLAPESQSISGWQQIHSAQLQRRHVAELTLITEPECEARWPTKGATCGRNCHTRPNWMGSLSSERQLNSN